MGAPPVRWLDELEMEAWLGLLTTHSALMAALDSELRAAHGLSLPEYEVLTFLSDAPDRRLRMSELAQRLRLSPSGLTRRIDGMVRAGFVRRETCDDDRRGSFAVLTDAGLSVLQKSAPDHVSGVRRHFLDRLSRRQLEQLAGVLRALQETRP